MEKAIMIHIKPLAEVEPTGRKYHSNPKSDYLDELDFHELNRLSEVLATNLGCVQTPLDDGSTAPCHTCRMAALEAMALYLVIHKPNFKGSFEKKPSTSIPNQQDAQS